MSDLVPLWLVHAVNKMHDSVDLTNPECPIGIALTRAGLERRLTSADLNVDLSQVQKLMAGRLHSELDELRTQRDSALAELERVKGERDAAMREADRLRHGQAIEGDFICPNDWRLNEVSAVVEASVKLYDEDQVEAGMGGGLAPRHYRTFKALSELYAAIDAARAAGVVK